ncbi:MAG: hypothetical protein PHD48_09205 [Alphaproteobacteria bacterium]|nr:hypothetical protein [Alphaproteobacteria bacterium]
MINYTPLELASLIENLRSSEWLVRSVSTGTWFDQNVNMINAFSALATSLATIALAGLTVFLVQENRALRKAGTEPEVVAFLRPHPDGNGAIQFVIENIGKGTAFNVSFELIYDQEDFKSHDVLIENDQKRSLTSILPQDEKIIALLGIGYVLAGKAKDGTGHPLKQFEVRLSYENSKGKKRSKSQALNLLQFSGLCGIFETPAKVKMATSLQEIEKHLAQMAKSVGVLRNIQDITSVDDSVRQHTKTSPSNIKEGRGNE